MILSVISWAGYALLATGLYFQSKKVWWAYLFSVLGESLWCIYAAARHDLALLVTCATFWVLAAQAMNAWKKG